MPTKNRRILLRKAKFFVNPSACYRPPRAQLHLPTARLSEVEFSSNFQPPLKVVSCLTAHAGQSPQCTLANARERLVGGDRRLAVQCHRANAAAELDGVGLSRISPATASLHRECDNRGR